MLGEKGTVPVPPSGLPALRTFLVKRWDPETMESDEPKLSEELVTAHSMAPDAGGTLSFFRFSLVGGQVMSNRMHTFRTWEDAFEVVAVKDEEVPQKTILSGGFN